jgi:hypothetical protein
MAVQIKNDRLRIVVDQYQILANTELEYNAQGIIIVLSSCNSVFYSVMSRANLRCSTNALTHNLWIPQSVI